MEIRPEIKEFAEEMERVMAKHDKEKGDSWRETPIDIMREKLAEETHEALLQGYEGKTEFVDVANVAMMLWHKFKGELKDEDMGKLEGD